MINYTSCEVLVIGAGAAGLNAMDELLIRGIDALLIADDMSGGTSINSGSDKQTYYKLSLAGGYPDSVELMADKLFSGGGMMGCHARAMAASSAKSFIKLANLGVPFPQNEWGEYVGYQTDHDLSLRATSAGPLTSKMMADALRKSVMSRGARIFNGLTLITIFTHDNNAIGALFAGDGAYTVVSCSNIILATGGASRIYSKRVFPDKQNGATGAALRAGCKANNLCYWQYGLASVKVKWNVSGSYQQAIPEYSDENGSALFADMPNRLDMIFLKGYQWPFDSARADKSAMIDRAVKAAGHAYMDFAKDPVNGNFDALSDETRNYLKNCGAEINGAYNRLVEINRAAYEFYLDRGIDLRREPLEIALCAQHSNGGLLVDEHWQTTVKNLYAVGECSGIFGAYRPGGTALNETQVGSLRAVENIAEKNNGKPSPIPQKLIDAEIAWLSRENGSDGEVSIFQTRMDDCAGAIRSVRGMRELLNDINNRLETLTGDYRLRDILYVQKYALSAMLEQAKYAGDAGHIIEDSQKTEGAHKDYSFITDENGTFARKVEPVPYGEQWFERVWKKRREEKNER